MTGTHAVEVSVHGAATPEDVFPYFTDPARYVQSWPCQSYRFTPAG